MKKVLLFAAVAFAFAACTSKPAENAEENVAEQAEAVVEVEENNEEAAAVEAEEANAETAEEAPAAEEAAAEVAA